jgi:outer membrane lipoprotein carrier protein
MTARVWRRAVCALIASLSSAGAAHAQDAAAQVDAYLAKLTALSSGFTQVVRDRNGQIVERATGTFQMSRPDRFRWEYAEPYVQTIVADGKRVWLYDRDLEQVTVRPLEAGLGATPAMLLSGKQKVAEAFDSVGVEREGEWTWQRLRPRADGSDFELVSLAFDRRGTLAGMELRDKLGQVTTIDFSDVRVNPRIESAVFRYAPPPGADVIGDPGP